MKNSPALSPARRELLALMLKQKGIKTELPSAIPKRRDSGPCPLSFAQERIWFFEQLEPGTAVYNIASAVRLTGPLNLDALHKALNEVLRRHDSLRTVFTSRDDKAVQLVVPVQTLPLPIDDLSDLPAPEQKAEAVRLINEESQRPFDLSRGPLLRCRVLRLGDAEHVAALCTHHIASDGWSMSVLTKEIATLYEAFSTGKPSPFAELTVQYADFAEWQRSWLQGKVLEEQLAYWKKQLEGAPQMLNLPTDRPRPPVQTFRGSRQSLNLSPALSHALRELSSEANVTMFMLLLAAFKTLLYRYSGQDDIVVGTPIANRNRAELENLIGFFVNTLVLRTDLSGDPSFLDLLLRVRETAIGAYAHQDLPFEKLVQEIQPERNLTQSPLFHVLFALQNTPSSTVELSGVTFTPWETDRETAKFDLFLAMSDSQGLAMALEYNTDLFDEETIRQILANLKTLLESIAARPQTRLSELAILTAAERAANLTKWNQTARAYDRELNVAALFEQQVAQGPQRIAVEIEGRQFTYAELNARANQLAHYLRGLGAGPETLVGIATERSLEMLVSVLGVFKAGAAYVPLDPAYPAERLEFMVHDSGVSVLLVQETTKERLPVGNAAVVLLDSDWQKIEQQGSDDLAPVVTADHLAYVIYTSGSTGKPKGTQVSHGALLNFLHSMREVPGFTREDVLLAVTTLSFDIAGLELYLPLICGGCVVLATREAAADGAWLLQKLEKVTVMQATPTTWRLVLDAAWQKPLPVKVLCGGEALPRDLAVQLLDRSASLWNMYGPTETTIWSMVQRVDRREGPVPIGYAIANTQIYLLDKHLEPAPLGVAGELYIGGDGVARGYWQRPALTAERFIPDPFSTQAGARLYRTGDLARYRRDGSIEYAGRVDQQVKVHGHRIEPGEIEAVLVDHPAVKEIVIVAADDPGSGKRLVAYVVQNPQYEETATNHDSSQSERVSEWELTWDETYQRGAGIDDPTFNITGWNSSITGDPIPADEMREWLDGTVARMLPLGHERALEIGCGTGLVLFRAAPQFAEYRGIDFSPAALNYIREQLAALALPHVSLSQGTADDLAELESEAYEVVILNSVVQYFPSVDYLLRVVEGALRVVRSGGSIFLGDIRNLRLLSAFHASIELHRAPDSMLVSDLSYRVQQRRRQEKELCLDPDFFFALQQRFPQITGVEIQLKRGHHHNELTRFRYDVILHTGNKPESAAAAVVTYDWTDHTPASIHQYLSDTKPQVLVVTNVPNARVLEEVKVLSLIEDAGINTAGELRATLPRLEGVEPEDLWTIAGAAPYAIAISWSNSRPDAFDAVFTLQGIEYRHAAKPVASENKPWRHLANNPMQGVLARELVPQLRRYAKEKLPDYLLPSLYVMLEKLPLTPNGKVDRKALPALDKSRPESQQAFVAPRTEAEKTLAAIWSEVLGVKQVGVHDNFFELGGDSILSIQMIARANRAGLPYLPKQLFQHQTIASLAAAVEPVPARSSDEESVDTDTELTAEALQAIAQVQPAVGAGPLAQAEIEAVYPLSPAQEGILFHSFDTHAAGVYVLQLSCLFRKLDTSAIERAWEEVVSRHAVLRTAFAWENVQRPLQVVLRQITLPLTRLDWRDMTQAEQEERFESYVLEDRNRGFSLSQAPLMRLSLIQVNEDDFRFVWTYHHLLLDGWAIFIVLREVFQFYEAFAGGQELQLDRPRAYREYINWLERQDPTGAENFWRELLKDFREPTSLRLTSGKTSERTPGVEEQRILLPEELVTELQALARKHQLTLNTLVQGVWALILSHYSGRKDVVFGVTTSGRPAELPGIESMVGIFLNVLPMRARLSVDASLWSWLSQLQQQQFESRQYSHSRLVQVQRLSEVPRGLPLFESILSFENYPIDNSLNEYTRTLALDDVRGYSKTNYALTLIVAPRGVLSIRLVYDRTRFDEPVIAQLLELFSTLLRSLPANAEARLTTMEKLMDETEQQQRLREQQQNEAAKRSKFKAIKPRAVSLPREVVKTSLLAERVLLIEPAVENVSVLNWAANQRTYLESELYKHGAVLLRGFKVGSVQGFEELAAAISQDLFGEYGDLPREDVGGKVYGSTPYPSDKPILFHNESSHLPRWPMKIFFHCVQAAAQGGETPIVDCRQIYQRLPAAIRDRFASRKLMYVRNYIEGLDVSWQSFFKTTDRTAAEAACRQGGMAYEWLDNGTLRTRQVCQAVAQHRTTSEQTFFNQIQLHHVSCLEPAVREMLLSMYAPDELPRNVYYGDGRPIEDSLVQEICELYREHSVAFPWQPGDVLMLDNMLTAHGRNTYVGPRRIVVAMAQMYQNQSPENYV
ncbi:MAG TPA: amino acid adenylation domain-containing protein [Pyrinomonadaceae bacterium]|nr:amino acid adenylation domain-containing protein [Pyrinomonadaceae bacterium]